MEGLYESDINQKHEPLMICIPIVMNHPRSHHYDNGYRGRGYGGFLGDERK